MNDSNIPSEEDFARAKRLANERWKNIDAVNEIVSQYISKLCPLHYFFLMPQRENSFLACVFFKKDNDIAVCKENGMVDDIQKFVYEELERQGRGKKSELMVLFEFDSDESVKRDFDGDYDLRLR